MVHTHRRWVATLGTKLGEHWATFWCTVGWGMWCIFGRGWCTVVLGWCTVGGRQCTPFGRAAPTQYTPSGRAGPCQYTPSGCAAPPLYTPCGRAGLSQCTPKCWVLPAPFLQRQGEPMCTTRSVTQPLYKLKRHLNLTVSPNPFLDIWAEIVGWTIETRVY